MIKGKKVNPEVMEFTSFKKAEHITEQELLKAVADFEAGFLDLQKGIVMHCLVKNSKDEYANVLFAENAAVLKDIAEQLAAEAPFLTFLNAINRKTVTVNYMDIEKAAVRLPDTISCIEFGTFALKSGDRETLLKISDTIETEYLNSFENTQLHFIGSLPNDHYAEVTFGKDLQKTQEICGGYLIHDSCTPLMEMIDETKMTLDFWTVIA